MKQLLICILNISDYHGLVFWLMPAFPTSIHALFQLQTGVSTILWKSSNWLGMAERTLITGWGNSTRSASSLWQEKKQKPQTKYKVAHVHKSCGIWRNHGM